VCSALLYAAPVWAAAPRSHLDKLQRVQNKFLRIVLNALRDTRIEDLQKLNRSIKSRMLAETYNHNHDNPLIREIGNYKIQDLPFRIRCRLSKHFLPINTYS